MTAHAGRHCPACGRDAEVFAAGPRGRPDARCPSCQSLERHRFLALLLDRLALYLLRARHVLEVAPQSTVRNLLVERVGASYVSIDIAPDREPSVLGDIRGLPFVDDGFDVVVCYHVFEHVAEDRRAMAEVARVLADDGVAIVQVPRRHGFPTDEDPDAPEDERARRFGQADHVRMYGDDFEDRLRSRGLHHRSVLPTDLLDPRDVARLGLSPEEEVWICATDAAAVERARRMLHDVDGTTGAVIAEARSRLRELEARAVRAEDAAADERQRRRHAEQLAESYRQANERIRNHPLVKPLLVLRRAGRNVLPGG